MILRKNKTATREKLLSAAAELFAKKGFQNTTIVEISLRSGTNIAAVNYHFGSKKNLYREAWRHAFTQALQNHPQDGGVAADAPPEDRLRGQVTALLRRVSDKKNRDFWFIQQEIVTPTGLLEEVIREVIEPLRQRTQSLVRELLGPHAAERELLFCELGIISQCVNPMAVQHPRENQGETRYGIWNVDDLEEYALHVVTFSLAGIRAVRSAAESRRKGRKAKHPGEARRP